MSTVTIINIKNEQNKPSRTLDLIDKMSFRSEGEQRDSVLICHIFWYKNPTNVQP